MSDKLKDAGGNLKLLYVHRREGNQRSVVGAKTHAGVGGVPDNIHAAFWDRLGVALRSWNISFVRLKSVKAQ
jgi:hypothetical protein